jgi:SAM-dependent methyltransferase
MPRHRKTRRAASKSWDAVAAWYTGWSGADGSRHHRRIAIPAVLDLLQPNPNERVLDIGCGPGALAPHITRAGARYVGVDASERLIAFARRHHSESGRFLIGDTTRLGAIAGLKPASFDAASFLLSIQDIDPLDAALFGAAWALKPGGRLVIVMTHPCFRVPRQSGWGWDEKRRLRFRRVDRYLTRLDVPMQPYGGGRMGTTRSYHRPLSDYFAALSGAGFVIDTMREIAAEPLSPKRRETSAEAMARQEFPLFLVIRALRR